MPASILSLQGSLFAGTHLRHQNGVDGRMQLEEFGVEVGYEVE